MKGDSLLSKSSLPRIPTRTVLFKFQSKFSTSIKPFTACSNCSGHCLIHDGTATAANAFTTPTHPSQQPNSSWSDIGEEQEVLDWPTTLFDKKTRFLALFFASFTKALATFAQLQSSDTSCFILAKGGSYHEHKSLRKPFSDFDTDKQKQRQSQLSI